MAGITLSVLLVHTNDMLLIATNAYQGTATLQLRDPEFILADGILVCHYSSWTLSSFCLLPCP